MRDLLIATLAGPLVDGETAVDHWPVDPTTWRDGNQQDAEQAANIAYWLGIDAAVDWHWVVFKARAMVKQRRFRALAVALSRALVDRDVIFEDEIRRIAEEVQSHANP